ncbi:MAG: hypothetical protein CO189_00035 [candidate division Zixibacteria bacterium CG_4_9_14_3_um_filter_46_8]|nr:MAG: hypothetical protein CO189_00035 [candidate division Zixibacteria bacterium CG_4_9_14_3_um_filter_46_8]
MSPIRNSARDFLYVIFKRKRVILWISGSFFAFVMFFTVMKTPQYSVSTKVYIQASDYNESLFGEGRISPGSTPFAPERLNTEIEIVKSWPVCEKITSLYRLQDRQIENPTFRDDIKDFIKWPIKQTISLIKTILGLSTLKNDEEVFHDTVLDLQESLEATPVPFSKVIEIVYEDRDPLMATKILNSLTDEYLKQHLQININQAKSSFYKDQINAVNEKLSIMEQQFSKYKSDEELISFDDQERGVLQSISSYNNALTDVRKEIISQRNKLEKINSYRRQNPDKLIPSKELTEDALISQLNTELVNLKLKLSDLQQKYTDESRTVIETKSQITDYEIQIREQVNKQLELEAASLDKLVAEENALESTISGLRAALLSLPKKEITYKTMEENVSQERSLQLSLREKYEESLVQEASDSRASLAKVIEYATVPTKPSSPTTLLNLIIALFLGPVISLSVVLAQEYFDHTINTPEDSAHYLNLQVLGSIDKV